MPKSKEKSGNSKEGGSERASRVLRNINALGAIALGGVAVVTPAGAPVFWTLAGINAGEAAGFEWLRRNRKKKRENKSAKTNKN
jgi:hypothetical protein